MLWLRRLALSAGMLAFLVGLTLLATLPFLRATLQNWTSSPQFQQLMSREVSKSMKLDGHFGPIEVTGMKAHTPSYTSQGWPGEAIASLHAEGIEAVFNPWAILRRVWQVDRITVERGTFSLRLPDDRLKRPPHAGPKPWHALFLPTRFYCPEIICPEARVEFPFQGQTGRLTDLRLRARMIGRDFEYRADAGRFDFPLLPKMQVDDLDLFITREKVDIRMARLSGLEQDPARAVITGRLGMREDKSIRARVEVDRLPFAQALPEEWRTRLEGRLTGKLDWATDASGLKTASDGQVELHEVMIRDWAWLDDLAQLHDNAELKFLQVPLARCAFAFDGESFQLRKLEAVVGDLVSFHGDVDYHSKSRQTSANLVLDRFDLKRWLPRDFKPRVEAKGHGSVFWQGDWKTPLESIAAVNLSIPACSYRYRPAFVSNLRRYGVTLPPELELEEFNLHLTQAARRFDVTQLSLTTRTGLSFQGYGHWVADRSWELNGVLHGLDASLWKPPGGHGKVQGRVSLEGQWRSARPRLEDGRGQATLRIDQARMTDFAFQKKLARFLRTAEVRDIRFRELVLRGGGDVQSVQIDHLRAFAPGKLGLEGEIRTSREGALSGVIWLGLPSNWLRWLPEAETAVFVRKKEGLCWAKVRIDGTTAKMQHDLGEQILRVLRRHPLTLLQLGFRAASWWLGDVLGTYEE